jgi:DNA polymerase
MIVGEAPGKTENDDGIPFVGKAGQLLRASISEFWDESSDSLYITNVVKCWPMNPDGKSNRTPTPQEIKTCLSWLELEIKRNKPVIIVLLGNIALEAVTGSDGISTKHGQVAWEKKHNAYVYPMFHPAYILRTGSEEGFHMDCNRLGHLLNRPWIEVEAWLKNNVRTG